MPGQHAGPPRGLYFLSSDAHPIDEGSPFWQMALPLSPAEVESGALPTADRVTYGDYFKAVHRFLGQDGYGPLRRWTGPSPRSADFDTVRIYLEKHGSFYHPARVTVTAAGAGLAAFVVNVAVTHLGRAYLAKDFGNIRRLNARFPYRYLPNVYAKGGMTAPGSSRRLAMFLGEWLEGYHEYHLSGEPEAGHHFLVVWDAVKGACSLSLRQRFEIYRQAALIMTAYYDLQTFEQISSWHNAAGDFIVKIDGEKIDLRLITVRKYAPLLAGVSRDPDTLLQALLVFLLQLSIRIRLDRLDGVAAPAWAGEEAVAAALNGFFDGLSLQARFARIPRQLPELFGGYLRRLAAEDRDVLLEGIAGRMNGPATEIALIRHHLKRHGEEMTRAIDRLAQGRLTCTT